MFIQKPILLVILLLTCNLLLGQIPKHIFNEVTGEEYNSKIFTSKPTPIKQRIGVYHFGDSEFILVRDEDEGVCFDIILSPYLLIHQFHDLCFLSNGIGLNMITT